MMLKSFAVVLFAIVLSVKSTSLPLPSYLTPCKRDDPKLDDCALQNGKLGLPYILKGDKKYGIPNFYPLKINEITMETAGNLKIKLKDVEVHGLENAELQRVKIDTKAKKFYVDFKVNTINILGKYDMDGRILILPIKGNGDANITAIGGDFHYNFEYKLENRDGEEYMKSTKQNIDYEVGRLFIQFDNLFNGDKVLGANANEVLNKEWESVFKEMKEPIGNTILTVASSILDNILSKVPHKYTIL
ncbi:protein takeout [Leptinotarsa decemlineata]|uniref:protein takeout n=1 Tax=Leptinotarsa decemlineata TaxID=7539 RepID=UPI000C2522C3|nr:protein takeout-like [Leptinotarsa decemlineata]